MGCGMRADAGGLGRSGEMGEITLAVFVSEMESGDFLNEVRGG